MRAQTIAALRVSLRVLEGADNKHMRALSFGGNADLDGTLRYSQLHEIGGSAASVFVSLVLAKAQGPVLCCMPGWSRTVLYTSGLVQLGFDPGRIVLVRLARTDDLLHAAHEGLRAGWHTVLELDKPLGLISARRLQLAAEEGGGLGFVTPADADPREDGLVPSARTRWRAAVASAAVWPAPLRLDLRLVRNREGLPGRYCVEWDHASRSLSVVSASSDRQDRAPQSAVA